MRIDRTRVREDLLEYSGGAPVEVKLDKLMDVASSLRITDDAFNVRLNPQKIRSQRTLDYHLVELRKHLTFGR